MPSKKKLMAHIAWPFLRYKYFHFEKKNEQKKFEKGNFLSFVFVRHFLDLGAP